MGAVANIPWNRRFYTMHPRTASPSAMVSARVRPHISGIGVVDRHSGQYPVEPEVLHRAPAAIVQLR
eukprot:6160107-Alexandrium_andersonii.AAC.1